MDMKTGLTTSLRPLTMSAHMFAWPDVVTEADYRKKHEALIEKVIKRLAEVIHGIDTLLFIRWADQGIPPLPRLK